MAGPTSMAQRSRFDPPRPVRAVRGNSPRFLDARSRVPSLPSRSLEAPMPRWLLYTLLALGATVVALRLTVLAPDLVPVRAVAVEAGRVETTVSNTKAGTVTARRRAKMSPENAGMVIEVPAAEGEHVEAGQPLVRLNDATQQAQLVLARESLRASQAALLEACLSRDRARRELARKREIAEQGVLSADALDRLETAYQVAEASCNDGDAEAARSEAHVTVAAA